MIQWTIRIKDQMKFEATVWSMIRGKDWLKQTLLFQVKLQQMPWAKYLKIYNPWYRHSYGLFRCVPLFKFHKM